VSYYVRIVFIQHLFGNIYLKCGKRTFDSNTANVNKETTVCKVRKISI